MSPFEALATPELAERRPLKTGGDGALVPAAVIAVLGASLGLSQIATIGSLIIPERADFAGVPAEFEGWRKDIRPIDPTVADVLAADDTIVVDLQSPDGEIYNLYMAYLSAQRDGRSWHSPRQCIPGGGWKITRHDIVRTKTEEGRPFNYNRMIIQHGDNRQLVYYWYDQRGRKIANEFVMKFWLIYDAVRRKRSDGAMVRLITPIYDGTGVAKADAGLQGMAKRVNEFLPAYAPH